MGIWDNFDDNEYNPSDYKSDDAFWDKGIGKQLDEDFGITESMAHWEEEQKEEESAQISWRDLLLAQLDRATAF